MSLDIENTQTELSDYEKLRINNIKRNNAKLRALGLISSAEEEESNARAEGKLLVTFECDDKISTKKRKRQENPAEGPRKSLRLQGIGADLQPVDTKVIRTKDDITEERIKRVQECREVRLRAAKAVAAAGAEKAAKENPTATYEHCLMRVKSMTEKGLANRVRAIERAAGKHCVVKMGIFKSCLQDEGMWELADLASEALERLKALKAPV